MFSSTVDHLVKSLGRNTLLPVPAIETSDNISPLNLVIKESARYFIFWKKYKHYTTEFTLRDILEGGGDDLKIKQTKTKITTYNVTSKLSLKGKFGVELWHEFLDVDLKGSDSVTVDSKLGDLEKVEVDVPLLITALNERKINLKSRRIDSLVNQSNKILGIITGVIRLVNDATLVCKLDVDVTADADVKSAQSNEVEAEVKDDKSRSLTLLKGMALAYVVHDLLISSVDGSFKVILSCDSSKGGFTSQNLAELDEADGPSSSLHRLGSTEYDNEIFKGLMNLNSKKREEFRKILKRIMELPKLIMPISELLARAETFIDTGIRRTTNLSTLNKKIGTVDDALVAFLNLNGFHVESNGTVEYPLECSDMFESCQLLISLLEELDDAQIEALVIIVADVATSTTLIQILKKMVHSKGDRVALSAAERSTLLTDRAEKLMDVLNLTVEEDSLTFSRHNIGIQASQLVLYAFWGSN